MWNDVCTQCQDLIENDQYEEAYKLITSCLHEDKEIVQFYAATLSYQVGKFDDAILHWTRFLQMRPEFPQAHFGLSAAYAAKGDLVNSYKHFEYRFKLFSTFALFRQRFQEHWDGEQHGDAVYVYHEQGIGDMIHLLRFLPRLKHFFKKVIVETPQELNGLITTQHGVDMVLPRRNDPLSTSSIRFDCAVSLGSLPHLLGITKPEYAPYIHPRVINTPHLKVRAMPLAEEGNRVGVCWLGSKNHLHDKYRSADMENFLPLIDKATVYNLTLIRKSPFINLDFQNFQETANVINQLDLVISVDTAVAHLAGAMNKPVWLLVREQPDPRWGTGPKTRWYPSFTIFRKPDIKKMCENYPQIPG